MEYYASMHDPPYTAEAAQQSLVEGYIIVSAASVWTWDLSLSVSEDIQTFWGRKFRPYDLMYVLARIATGGLLMSSIGFLVNSGTRCQRVLTTVTWLETLSLIFNSSLFLLRVIAIYDDSSRKVKAGFIFMWSTTFLAITGPFSARVDATSIGCNLNQVKPLGSPGFVAITIFDTLVFVAISAKVLKINSDWRFPGKSWIASFIHGDGLSHLSKVLLRSGQFYYLTTVGFNVFTLITLLSSNSTFSPTFRAGSTFVSLGLQNMMTCKVFRLLRLGVIQNDLSTGQCQSIEFASNELE